MRTSATAPLLPAVLAHDPTESDADSSLPSRPKKVFGKEGRYSVNADANKKITRDDLDTDNDDNEDNDLSDGESDDEYRNLLHKVA
jgi:hypothetical protein